MSSRCFWAPTEPTPTAHAVRMHPSHAPWTGVIVVLGPPTGGLLAPALGSSETVSSALRRAISQAMRRPVWSGGGGRRVVIRWVCDGGGALVR